MTPRDLWLVMGAAVGLIIASIFLSARGYLNFLGAFPVIAVGLIVGLIVFMIIFFWPVRNHNAR